MTPLGMPTIGLTAGTLVWTEDGPRSIEAVRPGDCLVGFDPHEFARQPATVLRVQQRHAGRCLQVLAGGRLLTLASEQRLTVFDPDGAWTERAAHELQPGMWLPVERRVPTTPRPITLPDLDDELTALVGEDALALVDALHSPREYFAEMGKRGLRLRLLELSGYLLGAGNVMGDDVVLADGDTEAISYYTSILNHTFGKARGVSAANLSRRLRHWMGEGLAPEARRALPGWVWQLESQGRAALLRGFFDAKGKVTAEEISVQSASLPLLAGVQALLGTTSLEATLHTTQGDKLYRLSIRNVRRFAEWIHSNVAQHAALLRVVYAREPRYSTDGTARLPLSKVRPALERIRASYSLPRRVETSDTVDEQEVGTVETLRLLATAFHDAPLREMLNQQLFLEPVTLIRERPGGVLLAPVLSGSSHLVANAIIIGSTTYPSPGLERNSDV